ncbi:hypothetical protein [Streptomyces griseomycini]|uniref:Uncharacterized protein n=1 Tax=Streptomyces griseomycini TaxID=66895 RepID=A0A7W7PUM5_9ACTN|nr:hypothetical protein [Streptomyces griseomycini]MBB4901580.1 hypothetical protein [Streptomyces griseomycini]GGQ22015.1 hypothetical protein GCM10010266_51430 [Streptomyces griseomycini]GGR44592.1 hypothetical protein GCM10015536_58150 [Streptomyces griseomycini]
MTTVDQILFGWAERDHEGNAGVRPLAHSGLPTIDRWAKRLQYVWATQDGQGDRTEAAASLVHLVFDDEAAVLRKLPSRNPHGRGGATLTHVLVGAPHAIGPGLALGLHDWPGWREHEPDGTVSRLAPLDLAGLEEAARPGLAALRERIADVPAEQLAALVARVLERPAEDFSVIARPDHALPMMTALLDITGPVSGRPWTFASRESTDKGSHQPRVVFLAARPPQSMYINQRNRVDVAETPPDTDTTRFAARLVDLYREAGHAALERIRPRTPIRTTDDVTAWQRSVPVVDGRIADVRVHFDVLLDDDLLDRAAARGTLTSVRARLTGELRGQPAQWLAGALRRWRRDERRARHHPELRDLLLHEAVDACLAGQGPDPLVEAVRDAQPPPAVVASSFRPQVPHGGLDLSRAGHRRLLVVALYLGLPAAELDRAGLLAASPADELLDFVGRYADRYPEAAHLVLRHLGDAGEGRGTARLWYDHGLLLGPVDRIAGGDRVKEVDCFRHLLLAAYGPRLKRDDAAVLIERAGVRAPLGLFAAALELASDEGAEQRIRYEISEQFLRDHGYAAPAPGSGRRHRPGGPVLGRPPAPPEPPAARPAPYPAGARLDAAGAPPDTAHAPHGAVPDPAQWGPSAGLGTRRGRPGRPDTVNVLVVTALALALIGLVSFFVLTSVR